MEICGITFPNAVEIIERLCNGNASGTTRIFVKIPIVGNILKYLIQRGKVPNQAATDAHTFPHTKAQSAHFIFSALVTKLGIRNSSGFIRFSVNLEKIGTNSIKLMTAINES